MAEARSLHGLPDEVILNILSFLDVPELLTTSRTTRHLRLLSLDPLLHKSRLQHSHLRVGQLLPRRPPLHTLQPPSSTIYLTRTHLAARRLHWALVCIRLNRSLLRRPKLSTLVSANIVPNECCKRDRASGDFVWAGGVAGALVERKRKVEREHMKAGLRVWLERKAREIGARKKDDGGGVGVLVWRFSRKVKVGDAPRELHQIGPGESDFFLERPRKERVSSLRRFFEGLGNGRMGS